MTRTTRTLGLGAIRFAIGYALMLLPLIHLPLIHRHSSLNRFLVALGFIGMRLRGRS